MSAMVLSWAIDCHLLQGILLVKAEQRRKERNGGSSVVKGADFILCFLHPLPLRFAFLDYLKERNRMIHSRTYLRAPNAYSLRQLYIYTYNYLF